MHCNLVSNNYQQATNVLFTLVPNKQFGQLIIVLIHSLPTLKITNAEFSFIEVWFTDQNNRPLEIKDSVNRTLITRTKLQTKYSSQPTEVKYIKRYGFSSFTRKLGDKFVKRLMDTATKNAKTVEMDAEKIVSKRVVQKTLEAAGDLIGNKIADKITSVGKTKNKGKEEDNETNEMQELYMPKSLTRF